MEFLLELDQSLFLLINRSWENDFFDGVLPLWRNKLSWIPAYLVLVILAFSKLKKQAVWFLLGAILSVGASDMTSSRLIKKTVKRVRPCNDLDFRKNVWVRVPCGSGYSFTSSHAANHTTLAFFLIVALGAGIKKWRIWLILWALSIGFAQIYVGVHYPLDVAGGTLLGVMLGTLFGKIYQTRFASSTDVP